MHENFRYYLDRYSPTFPPTGFSAERRAVLAKILPPSLAEFMCENGPVSFHDGLFRLCDPGDFRSVLAMVFRGDRTFDHRDCHVVGHTAFGVLQCWSPRLRRIEINLPLGTVKCRSVTVKNWRPVATDDHIATGIVPDLEDAEFLDWEGNPMFDRCVERHGRPGPADCFRFVPALAFAGAFGPSQCVDNTRPSGAQMHFAMLAQLKRFRLVGPGAIDTVAEFA